MVTEVGSGVRSPSGYCDRSPNGSARRLQALTLHRGEQNTASERRSTPATQRAPHSGHSTSPEPPPAADATAVPDATAWTDTLTNRTPPRAGLPASAVPHSTDRSSPRPDRHPRTRSQRRAPGYSEPELRNTHYGEPTAETTDTDGQRVGLNDGTALRLRLKRTACIPPPRPVVGPPPTRRGRFLHGPRWVCR